MSRAALALPSETGPWQTEQAWRLARPPAALYADGGVVQVNPSPYAGTWAWVHVDAEGERVRRDAGYFTPDDLAAMRTPQDLWRNMDLTCVSSNVSEFYAMLLAIEALPENERWAGTLYGDNLNTLRRVRTWTSGPFLPRVNGIPYAMISRMSAAVQRLDLAACEFVLLGGHPTRKDLQRGYTVKKLADGGTKHVPVSLQNVVCDVLCAAAARQYEKDNKHGRETD